MASRTKSQEQRGTTDAEWRLYSPSVDGKEPSDFSEDFEWEVRWNGGDWARATADHSPPGWFSGFEYRYRPRSVAQRPSLPEGTSERNRYPMMEGFIDYFPNAVAEVAKLSAAATKQHHPDQSMHWDRSKSTEHADKAIRHLVDRGKRDSDGERHTAKAAWRVMALLQEELEADEGYPLSRASRNG